MGSAFADLPLDLIMEILSSFRWKLSCN